MKFIKMSDNSVSIRLCSLSFCSFSVLKSPLPSHFLSLESTAIHFRNSDENFVQQV